MVEDIADDASPQTHEERVARFEQLLKELEILKDHFFELSCHCSNVARLYDARVDDVHQIFRFEPCVLGSFCCPCCCDCSWDKAEAELRWGMDE